MLGRGWWRGWGGARRGVAWVGRGAGASNTRCGGLLLTGNTIPDRWTPWVFIDPCSSFLCPFDCDVSFSFPEYLPFSAYCSALTLVGFFVTCIYLHSNDKPLWAILHGRCKQSFSCTLIWFCVPHFKYMPFYADITISASHGLIHKYLQHNICLETMDSCQIT